VLRVIGPFYTMKNVVSARVYTGEAARRRGYFLRAGFLSLPEEKGWYWARRRMPWPVMPKYDLPAAVERLVAVAAWSIPDVGRQGIDRRARPKLGFSPGTASARIVWHGVARAAWPAGMRRRHGHGC